MKTSLELMGVSRDKNMMENKYLSDYEIIICAVVGAVCPMDHAHGFDMVKPTVAPTVAV